VIKLKNLAQSFLTAQNLKENSSIIGAITTAKIRNNHPGSEDISPRIGLSSTLITSSNKVDMITPNRKRIIEQIHNQLNFLTKKLFI